ncbi:MAG TPA: hypothetical protein PLP86_14040, partial [Armatimonadota bacterium]|nr:hypothetical protein [Armatimonadota bacterium]
MFLFLLTRVPNRYRKTLIIGVTFLAGWFYFLEFMIPGNREAAPIRTQLKAAEQDLRKVDQDLSAVIIGANNRSVRITAAQRHIDFALEDLRKAQSLIESLKKPTEERYQAELKKSDSFAEKHKLDDKLSGRGEDGKIQNLQTKTLAKTIDGLSSAAGRTDNAIRLLQDVRANIAGASDKQIPELRGAVLSAITQTSFAQIEISDNFLTPYKVPISDILQVIGAFTVGIGLYSLGSIHGKSIAKRRPGWYNSFAFFAALVLMTLFAFFKEYLPANTDGRIISESIYKILFSGGLAALQATMFSLVAFYIVSAAYRAFRIKSSEAALMMMAAFFVMIGVVTFGMWLTNGLSGSLTSLRLENIQS